MLSIVKWVEYCVMLQGNYITPFLNLIFNQCSLPTHYGHCNTLPVCMHSFGVCFILSENQTFYLHNLCCQSNWGVVCCPLLSMVTRACVMLRRHCSTSPAHWVMSKIAIKCLGNPKFLWITICRILYRIYHWGEGRWGNGWVSLRLTLTLSGWLHPFL